MHCHRNSDPIAGLGELIAEGEEFTYADFASHSPRGFPHAYSGEWLVWTHRINQVLPKMGQSPIANSIARGLQQELLGNAEDDFRAAHALIMNGLRAAQKVFGSEIPASDRLVSLGHNSPEQQQALEQIDQVIAAVRESNDFPGDEEVRERVVAELSASRRILEASKVRLAALNSTLAPPLKWIMEKAAGTIIAKIATAAWDFFVGIHWL